jgi:biotin operon repressor
MPRLHIRTASALPVGQVTRCHASLMLQRAIREALAYGPRSLAGLAESCDRSEPAIRAEIARLRAAGYRIVFDREAREYRLVARPEPRRCQACGARLRRDNPGPTCDPCGEPEAPERPLSAARPAGKAFYAGLRAAILATFVANPDRAVDVLAMLRPPFAGVERRVLNKQVARLRREGHDIEGRPGMWGYIYHPKESE